MIKEIFHRLTNEERKRLMIAFEEQFAQFVVLPLDRFIGVNIDTLPDLEILEKTDNGWSYGKIKKR